MTSTFLVSAVFLSLLLFSLVLWGFGLRVGLRWSEATNVNFRSVAAMTAAVFLLNLVTALLFHGRSPSTRAQAIVGMSLELAINLLIPWLAIAKFFKLSGLRAVQA